MLCLHPNNSATPVIDRHSIGTPNAKVGEQTVGTAIHNKYTRDILSMSQDMKSKQNKVSALDTRINKLSASKAETQAELAVMVSSQADFW